MPTLPLPDDCELDDYDTDCTWPELADGQRAALVEINRGSIEEGDCLPFLDRNFPIQTKCLVYTMSTTR